MPILQTLRDFLAGIISSNPGEDETCQAQTSTPVPAQQHQVHGAFAAAHGFSINNSTMINIERNTQVFLRGRLILELLQEKRTVGAEIDSSERYPPPKCHPYTRRKLRGRIKEWREDKERIKNMFWLLGLAGVGKSAVAQTVAEEYKDVPAGQYCAAFFFSRPNHRDDPNTVIATLVCQLVAQIPDYKHLITEALASDSSILDKEIHTQFKELLVDPFRQLHSQKPFEHPILIILDGLDECKDREAQCLFIQLIGDHLRFRAKSPLLWLVCSRPEWHLKRMLSHPDFNIECRRDEIEVLDDETKEDVLNVLRDELKEIRIRFANRLPAEWPTEEQIKTIADGCYGFFIVVVTITRFIGDEKHGRPDERLQICLQFMEGRAAQAQANEANGATQNIFGALDLLYERILSDVDPVILPRVMSILCLRILHSGTSMCLSLHANVLKLDKDTFYSALDSMHSILIVPPLEYADDYGIQFYHASFGDYLKDSRRSAQFRGALNAAYATISDACLGWHNIFSTDSCIPENGGRCSVPLPPLAWSSTKIEQQTMINRVRDVVALTAWDACTHVDIGDKECVARVIKTLGDFDFRHMAASIANERQIIPFIDWLYKVDLKEGIIMKQNPNPTSLYEIKLAYAIGVRISRTTFPLESSRYRVEFISSHGSKIPSDRDQSGAFFLGSSNKTCLVRLLHDGSRHDSSLRGLTLRQHVGTTLRLRW